MSTFFTDISGAFDTHLAGMTSVPPIAWENIDFTPSAATLYLRPTMIASPTEQASLGDNGKDITEGIYQVDVFIPDSVGRSVWPDLIADRFKRGTVLTQNDVSIRIRSASILIGLKDENFYVVPVSIRWQTFTAARA
jgi:hypothetical protein